MLLLPSVLKFLIGVMLCGAAAPPCSLLWLSAPSYVLLLPKNIRTSIVTWLKLRTPR